MAGPAVDDQADVVAWRARDAARRIRCAERLRFWHPEIGLPLHHVVAHRATLSDELCWEYARDLLRTIVHRSLPHDAAHHWRSRIPWRRVAACLMSTLRGPAPAVATDLRTEVRRHLDWLELRLPLGYETEPEEHQWPLSPRCIGGCERHGEMWADGRLHGTDIHGPLCLAWHAVS